MHSKANCIKFLSYKLFLLIVCNYFKDVIEALRDSIVHILHTFEGSRIAMRCIWFGTKKVRVSKFYTICFL